MGVHDHRRAAPLSVICAVITVSDTRTAETDESGALIRRLLEDAGHQVVVSTIVPDDPDRVSATIADLLRRDMVDAILLNGGTGIAPRDRTCEAVAAILDARIDGFGELFRALSYKEIGAAAMLSRAVAGIANGRVVMAMPGSPAAVRLAMENLILPELGHIVGEARKR